MAQGKVTITTEYNRLVDAIIQLDDKIRKLESDIYGMQRANAELGRRVSDLESNKRMPPF